MSHRDSGSRRRDRDPPAKASTHAAWSSPRLHRGAHCRRYARQSAQPPWRWMTHRKNNLWRPNRTLGI